MAELLLGCGNSRTKRRSVDGSPFWLKLTTLDIDAGCNPDVIHDIAELPLPFAADSFDEIHAYHVLAHVGRQGDWRFFFAQWADLWRCLKPGGFFVGITPDWRSPWAWGDPGHSRVISMESLTHLVQPEYTKQIGVTAMADYRSVYQADFDIAHSSYVDGRFEFALRAVKPSRLKP